MMLEYFNITVIALLGAISPGPDFVLVVKYALAHDRRMATMASLGVGVGILWHTTYCILGLALVIANSIVAFNIIKYLGAAYLIYLGIKSFLPAKTSSAEVQHHSKATIQTVTAWQAFRSGLLVNILNPKCTLFMLSIFTMVINPNTPRLIQASYGIEMAVITAAWFMFLSYGFSHPIIRNKINKAQKVVGKLIGIVLIILGIMVILEHR